MQETLEYIEAYFSHTLNSEERGAFELRCVQDEAFAKEVAFYLTTRNAARELLMAEKQKYAGLHQSTTTAAPVKKLVLRKWIAYAAAACIILFVGSYFIFKSPDPQQLANRYIEENYTLLSQTMDASHDSLQLGIAAYRRKDFEQAIVLFEGVRQRDPQNSDAKKYAGLAYLRLNNYDKALECFKALAAMNGLYSNSGDFLQAVTLMKRNRAGDKEKAKQLLQKVVRDNEEGNQQAKEWLDKW